MDNQGVHPYRGSSSRRRKRRKYLPVILALLLAGGMLTALVLISLRLHSILFRSSSAVSSVSASTVSAVPSSGPETFPTITKKVDSAWENAEVQQTVNQFGTQNPDRRMLSVRPGAAVDNSWFDDAVFVGDSFTTGWNIYRGYSYLLSNARVVAEEGVSPPTSGSLWQHDKNSAAYDPVETIVASNPAKLYIMFGANALVSQSGGAEDLFISRYAGFIDTLRARLPGCRIYIESILLPTTQRTSKQPGLEAGRIDRVNDRLAAMARDRGCFYLNIEEKLCPGGVLRDDVDAGDGLHLLPKGYGEWLDYLKNHTAQ